MRGLKTVPRLPVTVQRQREPRYIAPHLALKTIPGASSATQIPSNSTLGFYYSPSGGTEDHPKTIYSHSEAIDHHPDSLFSHNVALESTPGPSYTP